MKKSLLIFGLLFAFSFNHVYAQTVDTPTVSSLQATIVQLLEQLIAQLEAQIAQLSAGQTPTASVQAPVTSNLESAATTVIPPNPNDVVGGASNQAGSIVVTSQPVATTTVPVGGTKVPLISLNIQAQGEDETLLKFSVDLGASTAQIHNILKNLYLVDSNGNTLKEWDNISADMYVQSGNNYVLIVPVQTILNQGTTENLTVEADIQPAISTNYQNFSIAIDSGSISAEDEAGITAFGPTQTIKPTFTLSGIVNSYNQMVPSTSN
jgi:hypothetical protein